MGCQKASSSRRRGTNPAQIRGQVHRLKDGRLGRFGWKAQVASLEDFVLTACANELGLEVAGHHQAASPLTPDAKARGLDLTADECAALVAYVRSLAPPVSPSRRTRTGRLPFPKAASCSAPPAARAAIPRISGRSGASTATCCSMTWARS